MTTERYDHEAIETRWQAVWAAERAFETPNPTDPATDERPHSYVLEMLPYPSGDLHMGHVANYTMGDVVSHFWRRNGRLVLHPMGYDAFGLPAENAAIRTGEPPSDVVRGNIAKIRAQMHRMGWSIDWSRELSTADPEYYRWTQWIFLQLFDRGLAYKSNSTVNCRGEEEPLDACLRRLANERAGGVEVHGPRLLRLACAGRVADDRSEVDDVLYAGERGCARLGVADVAADELHALDGDRLGRRPVEERVEDSNRAPGVDERGAPGRSRRSRRLP